jgi:hemerythrin-like metal-binding protein
MRPFLIWREDWLLGFQAMDEQHLELAKTLNELHRFLVCDGDKPRAGMDQLCQRLADMLEMVRKHFHDEEVLMQSYEYAALPEHHREHAMLLAEMQELIREIEAGSKPFTLETLTALKYWQIDHVLYSDRKFIDYLCCQMPSGEEDASFTALAAGLAS